MPQDPVPKVKLQEGAFGRFPFEMRNEEWEMKCINEEMKTFNMKPETSQT